MTIFSEPNNVELNRNRRTTNSRLLKIINSAPMASRTEKTRNATCNARYGGLDMAAALPSLNTELPLNLFSGAVYANSSPLNLTKSVTQISRKARDPPGQNP